MNIPPSFNIVTGGNSTKTSLDTSEPKAKREKTEPKKRTIAKKKPVKSLKLKEGEEWKDFCGVCVEERPKWESGCKMCSRWYLRGFYFTNFPNAESHVAEEKVPTDRVKAM